MLLQRQIVFRPRIAGCSGSSISFITIEANTRGDYFFRGEPTLGCGRVGVGGGPETRSRSAGSLLESEGSVTLFGLENCGLFTRALMVLSSGILA